MDNSESAGIEGAGVEGGLVVDLNRFFADVDEILDRMSKQSPRWVVTTEIPETPEEDEE